MKLRNKKTGEKIDLLEIVRSNDISDEFYLRLFDNEGRTFKVGFNSLAELNSEWEDYEEPKTEFYITAWGDIREYTTKEERFAFKQKLEIGNYFETREEAEKAVEKLKAWKRLKDYNVKFNLDFVKNKIYFNYTINNSLLDALDGEEQIFNNMKIVFGGEE